MLASVHKTRRCLIVHEDNLTAGFGAEIAAVLAQDCFFNLDAPVERLAMPDIPSPHSPVLLEAAVPSVARITTALQQSGQPVSAPMSDSVEVRAPAEQTEGTRSQILRWLKQVGEPVAENEPLIEIETDKVTVEVASPGAGVLREILKQEQDEIAPGDLLGRIESGAGARPAAVLPRLRAGAALTAAAAPAASRARGRRACSAPRCGGCWPSTDLRRPT